MTWPFGWAGRCHHWVDQSGLDESLCARVCLRLLGLSQSLWTLSGQTQESAHNNLFCVVALGWACWGPCPVSCPLVHPSKQSVQCPRAPRPRKGDLQCFQAPCQQTLNWLGNARRGHGKGTLGLQSRHYSLPVLGWPGARSCVLVPGLPNCDRFIPH